MLTWGYSQLQLMLQSSAALFVSMSPYLLLGFLFAGVLHVFVPLHWVARHLGQGNFSSVVKAVVFGIPLPLCSCGVIPAAVTLQAKGASRGAILSFLIATPITGADSILATYGLLGGVFTVARLLAAICTALLAGLLANWSGSANHNQTPPPPDATPQASAKLSQRLLESLRYAFIALPKQIWRPLTLGVVVGGVITAWLPTAWVQSQLATPVTSMLWMLLLGLPLYVCATGSIPIAAALMLKGLSPGAALVFLLAGPATNTVTIAVVSKELGRRTVFTYIACIALVSLFFGYLLNRLWPSLPASVNSHHHAGLLPPWLPPLCALLLLGMIIKASLPKPNIFRQQ